MWDAALGERDHDLSGRAERGASQKADPPRCPSPEHGEALLGSASCQGFHLLVAGEPPQGLLGEDRHTVAVDLEDTAAALDELHFGAWSLLESGFHTESL